MILRLMHYTNRERNLWNYDYTAVFFSVRHVFPNERFEHWNIRKLFVLKHSVNTWLPLILIGENNPSWNHVLQVLVHPWCAEVVVVWNMSCCNDFANIPRSTATAQYRFIRHYQYAPIIYFWTRTTILEKSENEVGLRYFCLKEFSFRHTFRFICVWCNVYGYIFPSKSSSI